MSLKATVLVGLDVHARQTHAAVLDAGSGEVGVSRVMGAPESAVVPFLERLPEPVLAVYEAGPTGFALARVARERGIDVRVVSPGSREALAALCDSLAWTRQRRPLLRFAPSDTRRPALLGSQLKSSRGRTPTATSQVTHLPPRAG
jgi:hypothetical protein